MSRSLKIALLLILASYQGRIFAEEKFWTELPASAPTLVNLPNLNPIIQKIDPTIVHISTSSNPIQKQNRPRRPEAPQGPADPFSNPEEFFERFFGQPFQGRQQPRRAQGSGFIVSEDGYILTNNHVIEAADKIEVKVLMGAKKNGKDAENTFEAKLIGRDPATDIAVIKIDPKTRLSVAPLGDSSKIDKGDWVLAFGNPFGLEHSVSVGIVSAKGREISSNQNRRFDDFIQTDAAINFGNSGGPLINLRGEVVGINTAITAQGSGIGFAVPVNNVKEVIAQLKSSGSVMRGYLGVMIQDVTKEMAEAMTLKVSKGVLINDIVPDGPAAGSDLKRGDIVVRVNGIDVDDAKTLQQTVAKVKPGAKVKLDVIRDGRSLSIDVKVGNLNADSKVAAAEKAEPTTDKLGITVGMTPEGVRIQSVEPASPADDAGLTPDDLIRKVNQKSIKNISEYKKIVDDIKSGQSILFDVERQDAKLFLAFRVP